MTERTRNVIVGITSLGGLLGLVFLLMIFGFVPSWLEEGYLVTVQLKSASGLSTGSQVTMNGIDIGRVVAVGLDTTPTGTKVMVQTRLRPNVKVPKGVRVRAEFPLIGGSATLAFDASQLDPHQPDYREKMAPLVTDGTAIIEGDSFSPLGDLAEQFRTALAEPTRSFEKLSASVDRLSTEWTQVGNNLNQLLETRSPAEVDAGAAKPNLATVLARTDARLKELQDTLAAAQRWLDDEQLHSDLRQTAANARQLTGKLDAVVDKTSTLLDHTDQNVQRLVDRYVAAADDLSRTLHGLQQAVTAAQAGDGTLAKLLHDPAMYNNINDAVTRLTAALQEMRLLLEKWKKEGVPVQF